MRWELDVVRMGWKHFSAVYIHVVGQDAMDWVNNVEKWDGQITKETKENIQLPKTDNHICNSPQRRECLGSKESKIFNCFSWPGDRLIKHVNAEYLSLTSLPSGIDNSFIYSVYTSGNMIEIKCNSLFIVCFWMFSPNIHLSIFPLVKNLYFRNRKLETILVLLKLPDVRNSEWHRLVQCKIVRCLKFALET